VINELEYNSEGFPIYRRGLGQNSDYWRNVVGQCVFWYKKDRLNKSKPINLTDKLLYEYFHAKLKEKVLIPVFGLKTTTKLSTEQMPEYIAECFIFLSSEIDVFEHGEY